MVPEDPAPTAAALAALRAVRDGDTYEQWADGWVTMEGEVVRRVREAEGRVREEWASDLGRLRKNFQVEKQD